MGKRGRLRDKQQREGQKRLERSRQGWGIEDGRIMVGEARDWRERLGIIRGSLARSEDGPEGGAGGD